MDRPVYGDVPVNRDAHNKPSNRDVRKVRSPHGTRVARAIVCSRCGADDRVHFAPRDASRALCRKCAAEVLGVEDPDAGIRKERVLTCTECGKEERTSYDKEAPFVCRDCAQGIWTQQGDRSKTAERLGKRGRVLRVRRESGPHD